MSGKASKARAGLPRGSLDAGAAPTSAGASAAEPVKHAVALKTTSSRKTAADPRFVVPSSWGEGKGRDKLPPASSKVIDEAEDDEDEDSVSSDGEGAAESGSDGEDDPHEEEDDEDEEDEGGSDDGSDGDEGGSDDGDGDAPAAGGVSSAAAVGEKRKRPVGATELAPEKLAAFQKAEKRKGIIYIGRVPPFMKPIKLRQLLAPYGDIGRVYLAPEDPATRKRRIAAGGNKKPMFTEGWVEFMRKRDAEFVVATLNNQPMGGNKRDFYGSDLWVLKYLPHFKWHHLAEKIAYEGRIRAQKLRAELAAARKEAEHYIGQAELAKSYAKRDTERAARAARKGAAAGGDDGGESDGPAGAGAGAGGGAGGRASKKPRSGGDLGGASASAGAGAGAEGDRDLDNVRRHFRQRAPVADSLLDRAAARAAAGGAAVGGAGAAKAKPRRA